MKIPYLDGIESADRENIILAVDLLELIRGAGRLGISGIDIKALTSFEFELASYLSSQIDALAASKGKASRG